MKKIIALIIAGLMVLSFAACGGNTEETTAAEETTEAAELTVAATLAAAFKEEAAKEGATTNSIATALSTNAVIPFGPVVQDMEEGFFNGFTAEISGFASATVLMPMIGTIPFVSYVFELSEDADKDAFIATLEETADLRWNICTAAEEKLVETEGNFVYVVMAPLSFEQEPVEEGAEAEGDVVIEGDEVVEGGEVDGPAAFDPDAAVEQLSELLEETTEEAVEAETAEEETETVA